MTTAALLRAGLQPDEIVGCPRTIDVGGRSFKNFEGNAQGAVPFAQDFAQSCNTAFVSLTERLPAEALARGGARLRARRAAAVRDARGARLRCRRAATSSPAPRR